MQLNTAVNIGKLKLKNPVMVASGTFGYAEEFRDFMDLKKLGAIVTKTITCKPRLGNTMPRTCETPAGMLNSIGLENPGWEVFLKEKLPFLLENRNVPIIVSIGAEDNPAEFAALASRIDKVAQIAAIELNISCPNLRPQASSRMPQAQNRKGCSLQPAARSRLIAQDPRATYRLVKSVRRVTKKTLITKLSPNVTDITNIALAAESAGSDAVSLINTIAAMSIDVENRKPRIATVTAGLSGPAIRPIAVRLVWEVAQKIKIPIIGMGGIIDSSSALEFFLAGATAVSVGTANFIYPKVSIEIIAGIKQYLIKNKIKDIKTLIGNLRV
jgi:dihydroorotate dehydrogenase (NAD+) catalytic subunit